MKRIDERLITPVLHLALLATYHGKLLGNELWERHTRQGLKTRYYLSTEENAECDNAPALHEWLQVVYGGALVVDGVRILMDTHLEVRAKAKILLCL